MFIMESILYITLGVIMVLGAANLFICIHQTSSKEKKHHNKKNRADDEL
ncbi:hypothetical protein [Isobaculum melis]|uniref:Uncharacterized protein n=1 Tax=Isobaculum melis TaxID=142588 RepID=A0A1H9RS44_9LACT|nr:hypothetical protein [Isobaculum melis]SER75660.1 hypothetical protein SAMN04488559_10543 [Isobaculum melis]